MQHQPMRRKTVKYTERLNIELMEKGEIEDQAKTSNRAWFNSGGRRNGRCILQTKKPKKSHQR